MLLKNLFDGPLVRQYAVVITVNLSLFACGLGLAWPSPILVKLRDEEDLVLARPVTEEQGSWIVSVGFLTGTLFNMVPALLLDRIGRKHCILLGIIPKMAAALLLTLASDVWMLLVGRGLSGVADAFIFTVVPMYASEIASNEVRGSLGTMLQIMCSLGIVVMLSVGPFVSYLAANILFVTTVVICAIPVIFLPDSPYFLYSKGRSEEALKVLTFLRGSEEAANLELKEYASEKKTEDVNKLQLFKNKMFLKSFVLVTTLLIGSQIIGFNAVSFYLQTVLESTQTSIRPEIASVIIGCIQLTASVFTTSVTDKFGRKPILSLTLLGMMLGMGSEEAANLELKEYASEKKTEDVNKLQLFKNKMFLKSFVLVTTLLIGSQIIGFNAVSFYLQTVLESTQTSIRPEIASVIIGCIQLTASVFTTSVTDKFGRKPILSLTLLGMMLGMIGLGTFFFVTGQTKSVTGFMNFLPLLSLIMIVFCFSAGPGSLNWALSAELFDNSGRGFGVSTCMTISMLSLFLTTRYFAPLMSAIGPAATYWGFAVNCLLLCLFIVFLVPETKGKSFAEIQKAMGAKDDEEGVK